VAAPGLLDVVDCDLLAAFRPQVIEVRVLFFIDADVSDTVAVARMIFGVLTFHSDRLPVCPGTAEDVMLAAVSSVIANADPRFSAVVVLAVLSFGSGIATIAWGLARRRRVLAQVSVRA
jgi:hypothetical protein